MCKFPAFLFLTKQNNWYLWKKAQQEVRQHWFITEYIAAYIQVLYKGGAVHPAGLTVTRGLDSSPRTYHFMYVQWWAKLELFRYKLT
jgi:hypothetical protein